MMDWHVAERPCAGETLNGDGCAVIETPQGMVVAVVDGLGHGREAAESKDVALDTVKRMALQPVSEIFKACHHAMRKTRGAAMCIASFDAATQTLRWGGVGNVEGILIGNLRRKYVLAQGGVVGFQLPATIRIQENTLAKGELIVIYSDGIRNPRVEAFSTEATPTQIVTHTLDAHGDPNDDALIWAGRFEGDPT